MAIAIRLTEEMDNKLTDLATKTRRSKSFVAREAIESYLSLVSLDEKLNGIEFISKEKFNESLKRIKERHAGTIKELEDR